MNRNFRNQLLIILFFVFICFLESIHWIAPIDIIKPSLLLLTFIYWNLALPNKIGLGHAITFGVFLDLLNGNLLGIYSFIFVLVSFLSQRYFYQFRVMKIIQQSFGIFLMSLFVNFILIINLLNLDYFQVPLQGFFTEAIINSFVNALFWAPFFYTCRFYRRKFLLIEAKD